MNKQMALICYLCWDIVILVKAACGKLHSARCLAAKVAPLYIYGLRNIVLYAVLNAIYFIRHYNDL